MHNVQWPSHAYIPGRTERHAENAFDDIKSGLSPSMTGAEFAASPAFVHGLQFLNEGYYWEAHEVFEPIWLLLPDPSNERTFLQCLIQVANAHLKHRMERRKACLRLCDISSDLLSQLQGDQIMGVEIAAIRTKLSKLEAICR